MKEEPKWENADVDLSAYTKPLVTALQSLKILKEDLLQKKAALEKLKRKRQRKNK